jgi:hypothetical protein
MMPRGGRREGSGRPIGAPNRRTRALVEAAESGGEMPIAYMLRVMRDEDAPDRRRDEMAKVAAPYLHPRITALLEDDAPAKPEGEEPGALMPAIEE